VEFFSQDIQVMVKEEPPMIGCEEAIRRYVCSRCVDFGADGLCHSHDPEGCAIFRFLPQLIGIAEAVRDERVEPYAEAVRREICTHCANRGPDGHCSLEESLDCALARYLPMVLEALENVEGPRSDKEF
jgi:hypothetical protein